MVLIKNKNTKMNLPNLISLFRFVLAFITLGLIISFPISSSIVHITFILTIISFLGDYLDGFFARKLKLSTELGAWLDIAADRSVEMGYLIVFAYFSVSSMLCGQGYEPGTSVSTLTISSILIARNLMKSLVQFSFFTASI